MASEHRCPSCHSDIIKRVPRESNWQRFLSSWGLYPFSCRNCRKRFYAYDYGAGFLVLFLFFWLLSAGALGLGAAWFWGQYQPGQARALKEAPPPAPKAVAVAAKPDPPGPDKIAISLREQRLKEDTARLKVMFAALIKEDTKKQRKIDQQARRLAQAEARNQALKAQMDKSALQGKRRLLAEIPFGAGRVKPGPKGVKTLELAAAIIRKHPDAVVLVGGHADRSPLSPHNVRKYGDNTGLSLSRAMSVYGQLKKLGVDEARMVVLAYGASALEDTALGAKPAAGSRRVSVVLKLPAPE